MTGAVEWSRRDSWTALKRSTATRAISVDETGAEHRLPRVLGSRARWSFHDRGSCTPHAEFNVDDMAGIRTHGG